ncbi:hypothetical protein FACS189444_3980 [Spirochaetia bacterium]|nr:hypothetical protein FACS189444_3980 [Spirochaetia bacterium]
MKKIVVAGAHPDDPETCCGGTWSMLMAASTLATIPCLVVFIVFQKYFVEGIALSGVKG